MKKIIITSVLALALVTPSAAMATTSKPAVMLAGKSSVAKEGTATHEMSETGTTQKAEGMSTKKKGLVSKKGTKTTKKLVKKAKK